MNVYKYILLSILTIIVSTLLAVTYIKEHIILDISYSDLTKEAKKQVDCLADNIYHEAGHEPEEGKVAVALVTLNRMQDPRYPKDICGVVKQKYQSTCQFSWFCMPFVTNRKTQTYQQALDVALHVYANYELLEDITLGALFYHADYVNPNWKLHKTVVIGRHIFYKESKNDYDGKTKPATKGRFI
jgi:N-acetylmuramoyl-L-alanine amidase